MADQILEGKRVLLTRPEEGSEEFKRKLGYQGAEIFSKPMIQLSLKKDQSILNNALAHLEEYSWVIFNSSAAVRFFFQQSESFGIKWYFFPDIKFATVGEKTKLTLEQLGYRTNFVPIEYTAEVLAENIYEVEGKKVLIPASELTSGNYLEVFEKRGAIPELVTFYENQQLLLSQEERDAMRQEHFDYLTFTSGSTIEAFHQNFGNPELAFPNSKVICIGPSTAKVANSLNWKVNAIAEPYTIEGMINCMKELEQTKKKEYDPS